MKRPHQDGYAVLAIILFLGLVAISLAAAVPAWKVAVQRQREARSIDHAREYRTAIRRYYHKNGRYPSSLEILSQKDGNGLRYVRQNFADPLAPAAGDAQGTDGKSGWDVIHFGQAVAAEIVDKRPQAAGGVPGAAPSGGASLPGFTQGSAPPTPGPGSRPGSSPPGGQPGSSSGPAPGPSGGGGAVIGVASLSKQPAVHAFNGFSQPNQWQFVYDYTQDPTLRTGGPAGGRAGTPPPPAPGTPRPGSGRGPSGH